jgi:hypothetical protein
MAETFHEYASNPEALALIAAAENAPDPRAGLVAVLRLLRNQTTGRFSDDNTWHWLDGLLEDVQ